ncbi:BNR-4 repeat-containing protein [candidate division KSB1 bacterium]|nr:BNR-4 repeat-containing protein [candidate division KSB1 bacterium]
MLKSFQFYYLLIFLTLGCVNNENFVSHPDFEWQSFTDDGAWCWFSDPRAVYHQGEKEQTYTAWVDSSGNIFIGAYNHATQKITTFLLHEKFERDDHDVPSILIRNDGRIIVFYSRHSKDDYYMRISENPEDITSWQPLQQLHLNDNDIYPTDMLRTYCYSNPFQLSAEKGRIYLFWRGLDHKPCISISEDNGETWSKGRILISPRDTYKNQRPYIKYASNYQDKIHFAFTDGHPRNEPTNGIYYACYRDGGFYRADGSFITSLDSLPLDSRAADLVYDARLTNVRAWVWDVAADAQGFPAIVYTRLPAETDHRYHYARWNGTKWLDHEIVPAGKWFPQTPPGTNEREVHYSGGIALDHGNPDIVFLSRPVNGVFEIEKWWTTDLGQTWKSVAITQNSQNNNIRPYVVLNSSPENRPYLLWMNFERYVHYTDYRSAIKMDLLNK